MNSSQESLAFSSQEMHGPLSQETLLNTLNTIPKEIFDCFMKNNFDANLSSMEDVVEDSEMTDAEELDELVAFSQSPHIQASIPVTENLPGCYNFTLVTGSEDTSKKCKYTFSPVMNKLYVRMNDLCPFSFSTSELLDGFVIRAMLYFTYPENRCIVVDRCYRHIKEDSGIGDPHFKHFIRAESQTVCYYEDLTTKRTSVTVNYENPAFGESYTTYLFKFKCYTSCPGGPNRRPMCIVFTLEKNGKPFGRCKIDLKVCSDPKRDRLIDEKSLGKKISMPLTLNKSSQPMSSLMINKEILSSFKCREKTDKEGFTIKVSSEEEYNCLRSAQRLYHMNRLIKSSNWSPSAPDLQKCLKMFSSSSYESE